HAVRHRAPQLEERQVRGLADDVPETDVERADRIRRNALALDPAIRAVHPVPQALDEEWVLTEQERLQARLEVDLDRLGAAPAHGEAVAETRHAVIGSDVRDDELLLRELERNRFRGWIAQDEAVDARDLHPSPEGRSEGTHRQGADGSVRDVPP